MGRIKEIVKMHKVINANKVYKNAYIPYKNDNTQVSGKDILTRSFRNFGTVHKKLWIACHSDKIPINKENKNLNTLTI